MDLKDKRVLVFGSGLSGVAAARLLLKIGAEVIIYDGNTSLDPGKVREEIIQGKEQEVRVVLGELPEEIMETLALTVISPGVPTDLPVVDRIRSYEVPIWGEIELAFAQGRGDVLAITGTNGKTTTTALLGEIIGSYKDSTFVV